MSYFSANLIGGIITLCHHPHFLLSGNGAAVKSVASTPGQAMAQSYDVRLHASMITSVDASSPQRIEDFVRRNYGWEARAHRLASERDELFCLEDASGKRGILRLANPADCPETTDLQVQALQWIARQAPDLPVPRIIKSRTGQTVLLSQTLDAQSGTPPRLTWLSTWLDGVPLRTLPHSEAQFFNIGVMLARLGHVLKDFRHDGAFRPLNWDLSHIADCQVFLPGHCPDKKWKAVYQFFDNIDTRIVGPIRNFSKQIIHADMNPHNFVMSPHEPASISGIFDFGDMTHTARVNDIAIAASYHLSGENPFDHIIPLVQGYHSVFPLERGEIDMLYDLIIARLCMTIVITEYRARLYPENRKYILKNTHSAWLGLSRLITIDFLSARRILRAACN
ncbi:phosphotransferase [Pantoea stewartii]|uniref:phosphotransferase n=2 Tax=Pantoea TaxID=53335 RepID=UPI000AA6113A|nr:phosphotransferase [Pantoea stewartii]